MWTEENLAILEKKLGYSFVDISHLKKQLVLFHAYYINPEHLPFPEVASKFDPQALRLPTIFFINQLRERKQELFNSLYRSIQFYFDNSCEKWRADCFRYCSENNKVLLFLIEKFNLAEIEYVHVSDSLHQELMANFCLFLCNAVFSDLSKQDKADQLESWLSGLLSSLYQNFEMSYISSESIRDFNFEISRERSMSLDFKTFEEALLRIPFSEIERPLSLRPLMASFKSSEDVNKYYHQWLPYILEESRASIAQQLEMVKKNKSPSFKIIVKSCVSQPMSFSTLLRCESDSLPDIDHEFQKEAVLIQFNTGNARNSISDIFAIASKKYFDNKANRYDLEMHILSEGFMLDQSLFSREIQVQWLAGLISFYRMYEACRHPSSVRFMNQIIKGELPTWPKQDQVAWLQAASVEAHLNPSQFFAVSAFHQAEEGYYCLQGPPGTGKTTTIASLLKVMSQDSASKIMVCAPSNKAVRVIAERTAKSFPHLSIAITGVAKDLPEFLRPFFVNDHANMICDEMERELKKIQKLRSKIIDRVRLEDLRKDVPLLRDSYRTIFTLISRIIVLCDNLLSPSKFGLKSGAKSDVELIQREFLLGRTEVISLWEPLLKCVEEVISGQLDSFRKKIPGASPKFKGEVDIAEIKKKLAVNDEAICERFNALIQSLSHSSESIEVLLLQRAQIIFCTLVSSGRPWLKKQIANVDILIVDEAAQCVEPEALIPLKFQPKKCLHVGDPKQLPATLISQAAQDRFYGDSMMLRLMELCGQTFQMLNIQYRMHPAICAWPSQRHYAGALCSAEGLEVRISPFASAPINSIFKSPCVFFDVKGSENRNVGYSKSTNNPLEAEALIKILCHLLPYLEDKKVGIITFYAAQVALLKELLGNKKVPNKANVAISTVDGFQGEEKDIILLSAVRTCDDPGFLKDIRRVNVAVTRPLHHLYIFGNRSSLEASNTDFARLIEHYNKEGKPFYHVIDPAINKF